MVSYSSEYALCDFNNVVAFGHNKPYHPPAAKVYLCLTTLSYMVTIFEGFMHAELINLKIGNDKALRLITSCWCIIEKQYYH